MNKNIHLYIQLLYMKELQETLKISTKIPESKMTVINVIYSNTIIKEKLLAQLKPYDLSIEQFNVLRILRGQNGNTINLQDIQERMVNKMSNTTRLIDKLIAKKLVKRKICKSNRRKVDIGITDFGLKILKVVDPLIDLAEKSVTENLTAQELKQLNNLLSKLIH